jgi:hypothetical protein
MAALVLSLTLETELVGDVARDLERIFAALTHRHGESFRLLEREIERLVEGQLPICGEAVPLPGGDRLVLTPSADVRAVIAEAQRLGVY